MMIKFIVEKLKIEEEGSTLTLRVLGHGDPQFLKVPIPTYEVARWADTVGASVYLEASELCKNRHHEDRTRSFKAVLATDDDG